MFKVLAIVLNTYREAIRNRILYIFVFFALALMVLSGVASTLAIGEHERIMRDIGLAGISFFGLMIALFVGIGLVHNDIERKTLYTIVSKPIDRKDFVLGKFFGLLLTIYVVTLLMTYFFFATLHFSHYTNSEVMAQTLPHTATSGDFLTYYLSSFWWAARDASVSFVLPVTGVVPGDPNEAWLIGVADRTENLITIIFMTWIELAIVVAFAVLFSCFSTPFLAFFFTTVMFVIGRLNLDIMRFVDTLTNKTSFEELTIAGKAAYYFAHGAAVICPNLTYYDLRYDLIYKGALPGVNFLTHGVLYGICYAALVLCLACFIFNRRNFK